MALECSVAQALLLDAYEQPTLQLSGLHLGELELAQVALPPALLSAPAFAFLATDDALHT